MYQSTSRITGSVWKPNIRSAVPDSVSMRLGSKTQASTPWRAVAPLFV
jgi:hypothetical protein